MTTKKATAPKAKKKVVKKKAAKKTAAKKAAATTAKKKSASSTSKISKKSNGSSKSADAKTKRTAKSRSLNRETLIEQTAYYIAEKRGFEGGDPVQDWLAAEQQVDNMLKENRT